VPRIANETRKIISVLSESTLFWNGLIFASIYF